MKAKIFLSVFCGALFGIMTFLICIFILPEEALGLALMTGVLFALFLFPVLIYDEKKTNKKYLKLEKEITSAIFYKANGNFNLGKSVRNGNIYFCENGIIFASFDQKPFAVEEVLLPLIEKYEFDDFHMNIYTKDERKFLITTADAKEVLEILRDKKWIE